MHVHVHYYVLFMSIEKSIKIHVHVHVHVHAHVHVHVHAHVIIYSCPFCLQMINYLVSRYQQCFKTIKNETPELQYLFC